MWAWILSGLYKVMVHEGQVFVSDVQGIDVFQGNHKTEEGVVSRKEGGDVHEPGRTDVR